MRVAECYARETENSDRKSLYKLNENCFHLKF